MKALCFAGEGLQACVVWGVLPANVLSAVARSRCKQRLIFAVFKALCGDDVCRCSFLLLPLQCIFQVPVVDEQSNEEDDQKLFDVILFSLGRFVLSCPSFVLPIIFLDMNKISDIFLMSFSKKKRPLIRCIK